VYEIPQNGWEILGGARLVTGESGCRSKHVMSHSKEFLFHEPLHIRVQSGRVK